MPQSRRYHRGGLPATLRRSCREAQKAFTRAHDDAVRAYGEGDQADRAAFTALKQEFEECGDHWISVIRHLCPPPADTHPARFRVDHADVQADSPEFRAGWLDNGEANLLRRSRSSRGDVAQAATLVTECLKELPGHQGNLDFAVEVGAELPERTRDLLSERPRILGDAR
jgi:hypothetical protein